MNKYTIYCTPEQTKKALRLGAPVKATFLDIPNKFEYEGCYVEIPTSEQMIGWLEKQGVLVDINPINGLHFYWILRTKKLDKGSGRYMWESQYTTPERDMEYSSRKETTLAAIDAALEYLVNNNLIK